MTAPDDAMFLRASEVTAWEQEKAAFSRPPSWHGSSRLIAVRGMTERAYRAISQRARSLGIDAITPAIDQAAAVPAGTCEAWLAADLLSAYADGMADVLDDSYGAPELTVSGRDLGVVLDAIDGAGGWVTTPVAAAAARIRRDAR